MTKKKTPQEIMTMIANSKDSLRRRRRITSPGSSERAKVDDCLAHLDDVLYEMITQDLHSRTNRIESLKSELTGATKKLKSLKSSIEGIVAAFDAAKALVKTLTALLPFL
jgi:hypothetical protein